MKRILLVTAAAVVMLMACASVEGQRQPLQLFRGNEVNLPLLYAGEPAFSLDTKKLWLGDGATNWCFWPKGYLDTFYDASYAAIVHTHVKAAISDLETVSATPMIGAIAKAGGNARLAGGWITYGTVSQTAAEGNDSRLSDARTPIDGSVTDGKVNAGAGIAWSKINKSGSSLADLAIRNAADISTVEYLLSSTVVDFGVVAETTLYTVPTGKNCVILKVIIRSPSASLDQATDAHTGFGFNTGTRDDVIPNFTRSMPTKTNGSIIWPPISDSTVGTSGQTFGINVTIACTASTTATIDVWGYLF
jgi:hypothetical protein